MPSCPSSKCVQASRCPLVSLRAQGRDVIAQAQSGTGKTATFSISILQSIDIGTRETQALVLSPTRELATQIQSVVLALGDYMNVQCHACIGGTSIGEDIRKLDYGQHVVSGTPGRVFDMIKRRNLRTRNIKMLVLDEADELLNQGFKDQMCASYLPAVASGCNALGTATTSTATFLLRLRSSSSPPPCRTTSSR